MDFFCIFIQEMNVFKYILLPFGRVLEKLRQINKIKFDLSSGSSDVRVPVFRIADM